MRTEMDDLFDEYEQRSKAERHRVHTHQRQRGEVWSAWYERQSHWTSVLNEFAGTANGRGHNAEVITSDRRAIELRIRFGSNFGTFNARLAAEQRGEVIVVRIMLNSPGGNGRIFYDQVVDADELTDELIHDALAQLVREGAQYVN